MVEKFDVTFIPANKTVTVPKGFLLTDAGSLASVYIDVPCGGQGLCGACTVYIQLEGGKEQAVLACQYAVDRNMTVRVPGHR